jgi:hypothetical protein
MFQEEEKNYPKQILLEKLFQDIKIGIDCFFFYMQKLLSFKYCDYAVKSTENFTAIMFNL